MKTLSTASKIINTLIEKHNLYASLNKYSNTELATIETYKHNIHVFENGSIRIETIQGKMVNEYKTVNTVIKKVIELCK